MVPVGAGQRDQGIDDPPDGSFRVTQVIIRPEGSHMDTIFRITKGTLACTVTAAGAWSGILFCERTGVRFDH
jgi:hypothetical protein